MHFSHARPISRTIETEADAPIHIPYEGTTHRLRNRVLIGAGVIVGAALTYIALNNYAVYIWGKNFIDDVLSR